MIFLALTYKSMSVNAGLAHAEYEGASTKMVIVEVQGDKTGWMHVKDQQILVAEFIEGVISSTTTQFNIEIGEDAYLQVPRDIVVDGTSLVISGRVTFSNLVVENGGNVELMTTSTTATYSQGQFIDFLT